MRKINTEALASRKGGERNLTSEVSETAKVCTDTSISLSINQAETGYEACWLRNRLRYCIWSRTCGRKSLNEKGKI